MKFADNLREKILELATPLADALGLAIWGLEITGGARTRVRLFIDLPWQGKARDTTGNADAALAPTSVSIDECEEISRQLGLALEVEDPFPGPWILEVSSPGLERRFFEFSQLAPYIGDMVDVELLEPLPAQGYENRRSIRGKLLYAANGSFGLEPCSPGANGEILPENLPACEIPWADTRSVSRIQIFTRPAKPGKTPGKKSSTRKNNQSVPNNAGR